MIKRNIGLLFLGVLYPPTQIPTLKNSNFLRTTYYLPRVKGKPSFFFFSYIHLQINIEKVTSNFNDKTNN